MISRLSRAEIEILSFDRGFEVLLCSIDSFKWSDNNCRYSRNLRNSFSLSIGMTNIKFHHHSQINIQIEQ